MEINFSQTIKSLRKERGITQEELANYLGISVQSVSKWERGDGMPDISLLPHIAAFYDTTVDYLLGCDAVRTQKIIQSFKEQAQALINKGKRRESLELCRQYQKKYPHNETVLNHLMHDLYIVDRMNSSEEIIAIASKLLESKTPEIHFGALQMLALTHAAIGNDQLAVDYARQVPTNKDMLRLVLKGDELATHCKWYFWKVCDELYMTESRLTTCVEAGYTPKERHAIRKAVYDIFHIVFSDGDFGFWENRVASACRGLALCSAEMGEIDQAFAELEEMCEHLEKYDKFSSIDHTSPMVKGLHYEDAQVGRTSERSLASTYLGHMDANPLFQSIADDARMASIKQRLQAIG
ncbi:MAG: helix-turn-helix transcriptional regulator [Clostridia bacterium]|nr:helix-turn-helix transcriptional regulator [Clostridia bacterium]